MTREKNVAGEVCLEDSNDQGRKCSTFKQSYLLTDKKPQQIFQ